MKKSLALMTAFIFGLGVLFFSCAGIKGKPTDSDFKAPVITLKSFEVPQYDEYWYFSKHLK